MSDLLAGFGDPVRDSQAVFRSVMDAMARPGRVHRVNGPEVPNLAQATAAVLLTLVDGETPLWLDDRAGSAWEWIAFHCGARRAEAGAAQFAVVLGSMAALERFSAGSDEEPEGSATVILQVEALGAGEPLRLSGPGLEGEELLEVTGLPEGFAGFWQANSRLFPRGIDVILCAGDSLAALPRTVGIN
ncbi:MAG: phosphonate C-P lyase system protein PhnH [Janthinobacterium lividum]